MEQKQALAERLKQANNILVTVSSNPSVDQLAACIGMTLALNKLEKHATAVFSGAIPNIIEFLEPEKTLEKNTDSLRDFIIALDKSKADKLRYKVEDTVVKIFITPYKTSINEKDLQFSQGDFNVDVVLALGVHNQADLDTAITSHGRILHDATVATVNVEPGGELGTVNWVDHDASSLSELAAELVDAIDKETMDTQIATAFLTGIVAETNRFSNDKTSPMTMTISAELMAAGANQQLVATKLEPPAPKPEPAPQPIQEHKDEQEEHKDGDGGDVPPPAEPPKPDDGTLEISHVGEPAPETKHDDEKPAEPESEKHDDAPANETSVDAPKDEPKPDAPSDDAGIKLEPPKPEPSESTPELEKPVETPEANVPQIKIDDQGSLQMHETLPEPGPKPEIHMDRQHTIMQPPMLANSQMSGGVLPEDEERPAGDPPASTLPTTGLLQRGSSTAAATFPQPAAPFVVPQPMAAPQPQAPPFAPPAVQIPEPPAPVLPPQPAPPVMMTPSAFQPAVPAPSAFQPAPVSMPPAPADGRLFAPNIPQAPLPAPVAPAAPPVQTLSEIEQNVNSPHLQQFMPPPPAVSAPAPAPVNLPPAPTPFQSTPPVSVPQPVPPPPTFALPPASEPAPQAPAPMPAPAATPVDPSVDVESARSAVMHAYDGTEQNEPIEALNAQPLGAPLHQNDAAAAAPSSPPSMPPPIMPPAPGA